MTDAEILDAAYAVLSNLTGKKLWMTERGLAKRLRRDAAFRELDHLRLREVLMDHAAQQHRRIRNSKSPSEKTLEVLWGAIRQGGIKEVHNPLPLLQDLSERLYPDRVQREFEVDDEGADYFLSYRKLYEEQALEIVRTLERRDCSVWIAGQFIDPGQHINDRVIEAMGLVRKQLVYVDESALKSLWVGKEALHGARLDLEQKIVLKGDDPGVMDRFYAMLDDKPSWFGEYGGESGGAAERFRQLLKQRVAGGAEPIYMHPVPQGDAWMAYNRLKPMSEFPTCRR